MRWDARVVLIAIALASFDFGVHIFASGPGRSQESIPPPPIDRTAIYVVNGFDLLDPLPFETGTTPIKTDVVAKNDKTSYVEVKGLSAPKIIDDGSPRFFLFVPDEPNVHPPFLVRLTQKNGARRVTAMAQKGLKGFGIYSEEIVKPHYRVISRSAGALFMEIRPRQSLAPGEYAIIGSDLKRIATFGVAETSNR